MLNKWNIRFCFLFLANSNTHQQELRSTQQHFAIFCLQHSKMRLTATWVNHGTRHRLCVCGSLSTNNLTLYPNPWPCNQKTALHCPRRVQQAEQVDSTNGSNMQCVPVMRLHAQSNNKPLPPPPHTNTHSENHLLLTCMCLLGIVTNMCDAAHGDAFRMN